MVNYRLLSVALLSSLVLKGCEISESKSSREVLGRWQFLHQRFVPYEYSVDAWINNKDISHAGDTVVFIYCNDTIMASGPGKYLSHGGEAGNNSFYGESLVKGDSEMLGDFIKRLRIGRNHYCSISLERCSDKSEYDRSEQNLDILRAYYLCKIDSVDKAITILSENQENWNWPSKHHDLLVALLMKKYSRKIIENEVRSFDNIPQRFIVVTGIRFDWVCVSSYHFAEYDQYDWEGYFTTAMDQIEMSGI